MFKVLILATPLFLLVECLAPYGDREGNGKHGEDYYTEPHYSFSYEVNDPHTHDIKGHKEGRQGEYTQGLYYLVEPDGSKRTVQYVVEGKSGFNAIVNRANSKFSITRVKGHEGDGNIDGGSGYGSDGNYRDSEGLIRGHLANSAGGNGLGAGLSGYSRNTLSRGRDGLSLGSQEGFDGNGGKPSPYISYTPQRPSGLLLGNYGGHNVSPVSRFGSRGILGAGAPLLRKHGPALLSGLLGRYETHGGDDKAALIHEGNGNGVGLNDKITPSNIGAYEGGLNIRSYVGYPYLSSYDGSPNHGSYGRAPNPGDYIYSTSGHGRDLNFVGNGGVSHLGDPGNGIIHGNNGGILYHGGYDFGSNQGDHGGDFNHRTPNLGSYVGNRDFGRHGNGLRGNYGGFVNQLKYVAVNPAVYGNYPQEYGNHENAIGNYGNDQHLTGYGSSDLGNYRGHGTTTLEKSGLQGYENNGNSLGSYGTTKEVSHIVPSSHIVSNIRYGTGLGGYGKSVPQVSGKQIGFVPQNLYGNKNEVKLGRYGAGLDGIGSFYPKGGYGVGNRYGSLGYDGSKSRLQVSNPGIFGGNGNSNGGYRGNNENSEDDAVSTVKVDDSHGAHIHTTIHHVIPVHN